MVTSHHFIEPVEASQSHAGGDRRLKQEEEYVPGEVLVLLSADVDRNGSVAAAEDLSGVEAVVDGQIKRRVVFSRGKEVLRVKLPDGKSVETAIAENWGARDRRILLVEPNYRVHIARTPNDPCFPQLWGMHNTGQTGGTKDADIDAPEAWDVATGVPETSDIIVGITDTGIDYLHPDLVANMWVNPGEIPDNRIDDDGNGYIDDVYGYDFFGDDSDPSDAAGHGTHCDGTIAGVGDNGRGVAGVNWRCKIMALRFLDAIGHGNTGDAIEAIIYGVNNGAKILSNSWGGDGYSEAMELAIMYARDHGVLFVAAAGNYGGNTDSEPYYPASYEVSNVISVAATDHKDLLASFSNFGDESVDVGAPGVSILSSVPTYRTVFFEDFQGADTPTFDGTQMTREGVGNYWGTVLSPVYYEPNNIAARGDWNHSRPYSSGSYGSIVMPDFDARGLRGLTLEFDYRYEIGESDELSVEVWDSMTWHEIFSRSNPDNYNEDLYFWTLIEIPESYRNEEMKIRFRWFTDTDVVDSNYFGAEIDNILVRCIVNHVGDYVYQHGTSMATPHVAGVAALVMANAPVPAETTISLDELKTRLVWTGDPVPALDGKTVSGCRLNAYNALTASTGLKVVAPNGGERWELLSKHDIKWYSIGTPSVFDIYLYKGSSFYSLLAEDVPGSGKFTWKIPVSLPSDSDYRILITDGTYSDESDGDFELYCKPLIKPSFSDPCNGASDVGVDTDLIWNFGGGDLEPVTILFDELEFGTRVDGMIIGNVTFGFSSNDAAINGGPGNTLYAQVPYIEGDATGTLTLDFAIPVFGISYGFVLSAMGSHPDASTMVFLDSLMRPIGTFSADAAEMGFGWMEGLNFGTSTRPIARVYITFSHPQPEFTRFALDNITHSTIPGGGGLPGPAAASESGGTDEAEAGVRGANGAEGGFQPWIQSDLLEYGYMFTGVRPGEEYGLKDSEEPETIASAGSVAVLHSGGPDVGDYIFVDSYDPNGPSFDWIEIGTVPPPPPPGGIEPETEPNETITGIYLGLTNDSHYYPIELPFSFYFYGSIYNRVAIGSNGTIYFEDEFLGLNNCCIPCNTDYYVQRLIAVYWDDLKPNPLGTDNVYYSIVGEAPNRILVVQWEKVSHFGSEDDRVTCQAQLFEGSNEILLLYADPSSEAGLYATVGIQRDHETGLNYMCNEAALEPNLAVLFNYQPPCLTTWDVYLGTDPNAMELIESDLTYPICDPTSGPGETLMRGMRYYWRVVVKNCCNAVDGNDWSFTTVNIPPVADAGQDQTVECACNTEQGIQVTLDGTRSSDAEGTPLTYTWTGPFHESPVQGATPTVTLDNGCPGEYVITLIVNDGIDDSEPNDVVITVEDTTPPVLICPEDIAVSSSGFGGVEVSWTATATDRCDQNVVVTTNIPSGSFFKTGVTTVSATATDACGNSSTCTFDVLVSCFGVNHAEIGTRADEKGNMVEIDGTFEPAMSVNLMVDDVTYTIDDGQGHTFTLSIPAGSFEANDKPEEQSFKFHSAKDGGPDIKARFDFLRCRFGLKVKGAANTNEISGASLTFGLQAGANIGQEVVEAKVEPGHLEYKKRRRLDCCKVDLGDLARLVDRWLWLGPEGTIPEDLNGDGIVNFADIAIFANNWIQ